MMLSKYDALQKILRWCKRHHKREFYSFEVDVPSQSIISLCNNGYRRKEYVFRVRKSTKRDHTRGRWRYRLAEWVDLD